MPDVHAAAAKGDTCPRSGLRRLRMLAVTGRRSKESALLQFSMRNFYGCANVGFRGAAMQRSVCRRKAANGMYRLLPPPLTFRGLRRR